MKRWSLLPVVGLLTAVLGLTIWAGRETGQAHTQIQPFWVHVKAGKLVAGKRRSARLAVHDQGRTSFEFEIPDDAVLAEIKLFKAPIDLDFYLTYDRIADEYTDADHAAERDRKSVV